MRHIAGVFRSLYKSYYLCLLVEEVMLTLNLL